MLTSGLDTHTWVYAHTHARAHSHLHTWDKIVPLVFFELPRTLKINAVIYGVTLSELHNSLELEFQTQSEKDSQRNRRKRKNKIKDQPYVYIIRLFSTACAHTQKKYNRVSPYNAACMHVCFQGWLFWHCPANWYSLFWGYFSFPQFYTVDEIFYVGLMPGVFFFLFSFQKLYP